MRFSRSECRFDHASEEQGLGGGVETQAYSFICIRIEHNYLCHRGGVSIPEKIHTLCSFRYRNGDVGTSSEWEVGIHRMLTMLGANGEWINEG